jgi:PEP-CTERM motif
MKQATLAIAATVAAILLAVPPASADVILLGQSQEGGTGFGNVVNVLTLQETGMADGTEQGAIAPADVESGDAQPNSDFVSFSELATLGITSGDDLAILYNVNQNVNLYTELESFSIDVYDGATNGSTLVQSFTYTGPSCDTGTGTGCFVPIGTNGTGIAGYLFGLDATQAAAFSSLLQLYPDGGIGMTGLINLANDGPENFFVLNREAEIELIPEPSSLLLFGTALLVLRRRLTRSKA